MWKRASVSRRIAASLFGGWVYCLGYGLAAQQAGLENLRTAAEESDYRRTSLSGEVVEFVEQCATVPHVRSFSFGATVEGRPLVAAVAADPPYELGQKDERLRVLVIGNIHSGECDGKEAMLAILRRIAQEPQHPWLKNLILILAPNYNADGNDRIGLNHRPGQGGPELGMGIRENAQQLDLNRDFVKIESPEAQALVKLFDQVDPHIFIDCHTTNGSLHQYGLTYDVPHNPASPESIRNYMRQTMMPAITKSLEGQGLLTYYYGNFNGDKTRWESFGFEPRYSTEYAGMRGRLGILSESYSHSSFKDRVIASEQFVSECLRYAHDHAEAIQQLVAETDAQFIERAANVPQSIVLAMDAQMVPFAEKVPIKAWDDDNQPKDYLVDFVGDFRPTRTIQLPYAYVLPAEYSGQADRLRRHGIRLEALSREQAVDVQVYTIDEMKRSSRAFQRHNMVSLRASERTETRTLPAGTYLIRTAQPLGRLAAYLLEPSSNDGLAAWNFFDEQLAVGGDFPVLKVNGPVDLAGDPVSIVEPRGRLTIEQIYGADSRWAARTVGPRWNPDGQSYLQEWDGWSRSELQMTVATGAMSQPPHNDLRKLRVALRGDALAEGQRESILAAKRTLAGDGQSVLLVGEKLIARWDLAQGAVAILAETAAPIQHWQASRNGQSIAAVVGNNVWIFAAGAEPWQVTTDGDDLHLNGMLDWVYQEELYGRGDYQGMWVDPEGERVAFLKFDETAVPRQGVVNYSEFSAPAEVGPYPNAGDPLPKVTLHVADIASRQVNAIDFSGYGDHDLLISWVGWTSAPERLACFLQDRQQSWLDVCAVDATSGKLQRLIRDQTPASIRRPSAPIWFRDGRFVLLSPRDGYNHIYLYDAGGTLLRQLTQGRWQVTAIHGLAEDESRLYFSGHLDSPLRTQVLAYEFQTGATVPLTSDEADHVADFNSKCTHFFDQTSRAGTPPRVVLRDAHGQAVRTISDPPDAALEYLAIDDPEFFEVSTRDGGVMDAMLIRPADFDPAKKYPVIVHVYAGPQSPTVRDAFRGANYLWHQMMAQHGYAVWMCDNRSSSRRGQAAAWETHGDLGKQELADILDGLDWLQRQNAWVDAERIGIWGWSYGGFMSSYAMTHSDRFKAGVAGAPVTDWRNYDAIYTERLMKLPNENSAGYDASSVVQAAGDLHGKLLLVHGLLDDNVHVSNTLQLAAALQIAGKPFEMMLYTRNRHGITESDQRLHCWRTIAEFFLKNL